jgi:hypothetical protein
MLEHRENAGKHLILIARNLGYVQSSYSAEYPPTLMLDVCVCMCVYVVCEQVYEYLTTATWYFQL